MIFWSSLLTVGIALIVGWLVYTQAPFLKAPVITLSVDQPLEEKPDKDTYQWSGGPRDPKYITVPSINAEGFLQNVGVDQNRQIAVPTNIHIGGWFIESVLPGELGLSIIDGHVDGRENSGIFKDLAQVKPQDTFTVRYGDNRTEKFKVVGVEIIDVDKAQDVVFSQSIGVQRQLNLVSCAGSFDTAKRSYSQRVVVRSELVPR